jgi:hypothetical protein
VFEVVAVGTWVYDGAVTMPVRVVRLDRDYWYDVAAADGGLEPGERPDLNADGHRYYVYFRENPEPHSFPDDGGEHTLEAAKAAAERRLPSPVTWR